MSKIKILFLLYDYPYGNFGPSAMCTLRIMNELCQVPDVEVHCVSGNGQKEVYPINPLIIIHHINYVFKYKKHLLRYILYGLFFPVWNMRSGYVLYRRCKHIVEETQFDLVVTQYHPEASLLAGIFLRRGKYINNLAVIFWDNLYGKTPRRFIPKWFSKSRLKRFENYVAKNADTLISLYPIKTYHEKNGDVPAAIGKRYYLGIPSITKPNSRINTSYSGVIEPAKINMLYSGTIFRESYVRYIVELLNQTEYSSQINLIFFSRGLDENVFDSLKKKFKGEFHVNDWIPLNELLSLYNDVDCFISFPGHPEAICSKLYEYVSYGKPVILLYDNDGDVNVKTFSKYPISLSLDMRAPLKKNTITVNDFLSKAKNFTVDFEKVKVLFPQDTASAYVNLLLEQID